MKRSIAVIAACSATVLCPLSALRAAQPSWDSLAESVFVVLYQNPYARPDTAGMWRYGQASKAFERLRPLEAMFSGSNAVGCFATNPQPAFLTALGDRLLYEDPVVYVEFDSSTLREVRRYQAAGDAPTLGKAILGPAVESEVAANLGLDPGIYGLFVCLPYCFLVAPYGCASTAPRPLAAVYRRGVEPWPASFEARADTSQLSPTSVSFDPIRHGFWLTTATNPYLLPVREGLIDVTGAVEQTIEHRIATIFRHPASGKLFGLRLPDNGAYFPAQFVALDESLHIVGELGSWGPGADQPKDKVPWTFAALQPTPPAEYEQTVPIVVHARGKNGSSWMSDLWLYNPSGEPTSVNVRRVAVPDAPDRIVELPAHGSFHIADALSWAGGGPTGDGVTHDALVLTAPYRLGEQIVASGRDSTLSTEPGERAVGGTVGHGVTAIPGRVGYSNHLTAANLPPVSYAGQPALLLLDDSPRRFRHDLGVVNSGDEALVLTLWWGMETTPSELSGNAWPPVENARSVTTPPHSVRVFGIEELFPASIRENWPAKLGVVGERPAPIWLSMVDNLTNDATFVPFSVFSMKGDGETPVAFPVVADVSGEHGSWWRSDLYADQYAFSGGPGVFHPSSPGAGRTFRASTAAMRQGGSDASSAWIVRDVVKRFVPAGGVRGAVEYHVGSWMAGYVRNYTTRPDGGTYGDMLPFYPPHGWPVQHFAGIEVSPRFRVNLGLFNGDADHAITHRLSLYAADGRLVAQQELTLAPWENLNERLEKLLGLPIGSLPDGTYGLTVLPLDDPANGVEGRSWGFVSLVDNVTNDPTHWW